MNTFQQTRGHTTKQLGDDAEEQALAYLQDQGLQLLVRNYRTPGRGGGEIDLIVREPSGTVVFVEVRRRADQRHGGAMASISLRKQGRIVFAAQHYLRSWRQWPPCRFDVVVVEHGRLQWLQAAFEAHHR
jgi:putative endonuclease